MRESVEVTLFAQDGELYVLAKSAGRQAKEIAIRRKKLARLPRKLRAMRRSCPKRDQLPMRVGRRKNGRGAGFRIREDQPAPGGPTGDAGDVHIATRYGQAEKS